MALRMGCYEATLFTRGERSGLNQLAVLMGGVVLYMCGGLWLAALIGHEAAFTQGVIPFLLGDVVKALLAAVAVCGFRQMTTSRG